MQPSVSAISLEQKTQIKARLDSLNFGPSLCTLLESRLSLCSSLPSFSLLLSQFLHRNLYRDDKWSYFKLMFSLDMLTLLDIIHPTSIPLIDYIDRLYSPYHFTNLKIDGEKQGQGLDSSEEITNVLLNDKWKKGEGRELARAIVSLHLEIKEDSLMQIEDQIVGDKDKKGQKNYDPQDVVKKYNKIDKLLKELHVSIMISLLKQSQYNDKVKNNEFWFTRYHYDASKEFRQCFRYLELMLYYEGIMNQKGNMYCSEGMFEEYKEKDKENEKEQKENEEKGEIKQIVKEVKEIDVHFILGLLLKTISPNQIPPQLRPNDEIYSNLLSLDELNLIKFKAIQHFFQRYKLNIPQNPPQNISSSFKTQLNDLLKIFDLHLFSRKPYCNLFRQLSNFLKLGIKQLIQRQAQIQDKNNTLQNLFKMKCVQKLEQINSFFNVIDLKISALICSKWTKNQSEEARKRILVIGPTRIGKSSLINFMAQKEIAVVGDGNGQSTTFFPKEYNINQFEDWEIYDLPGLMDSRTFIHNMCVCYFLHYSIIKSREIKFVYMDKTELPDANNFQNFVKMFGNIFLCEQTFLDSLLILYSQNETFNGAKTFLQKCSRQIPQNQTNKIITNLQSTSIKKSNQQKVDFIKKLRLKIVDHQKCGFFTVANNNSSNPEIITSNIPSFNKFPENVQIMLRDHAIADNNTERTNLINKINETPSTSQLNFYPIHLLNSEHLPKINNLAAQIKQQSSQFLLNNNKSNKNNRQFYKMFDIISMFKQVDNDKAKCIYENQKRKYQEEYNCIYDNYTKLNQFVDDKKIQKVLESYVINEYLEFDWKVSLEENFKDILRQQLRDQRETILSNMSDRIKSQINKQQHANKQIQHETIEAFFKSFIQKLFNKQAIAKQIIQYFYLLIQLKQSKNSDTTLSSQKSQSIIRDYKSFLNSSQLFAFPSETKPQLFSQILERKQQTSSNKLFLTFLLVYKKNSEINDQVKRMTYYFLEMQARQNFQNKQILEQKAKKINILQNNNGNQFNEAKRKALRFNYYGQCYCDERVKLSEILKLNSRQNNNVYQFLEFKNIRIYCEEIEFDIQTITILCQHSFKIIANNIMLPHDKYSIDIKIDQYKPATVVILWQQSNRQQIKQILQSSIVRPNHSSVPSAKETLISRTLISSGQYYQTYEITPHYIYISQSSNLEQYQSLKKNIILKKRTTTDRLLEFGELHLRKTGILLKKHRQELSQNYFTESQMKNQRKIIEYVIDDFNNNTSVELNYELFSTTFCDKIALIVNSYARGGLNELLGSNSEEKQKFLQSCSSIMKQHLYSHIFRFIDAESNKAQNPSKHELNMYSQKHNKRISKFCQNLLSMNLIQFQKMYSKQQNLLSLTKKFIMQFQTNILFQQRKGLNLINFVKSVLKTFLKFITNKQIQELRRDPSQFVLKEMKKETARLILFSQYEKIIKGSGKFVIFDNRQPEFKGKITAILNENEQQGEMHRSNEGSPEKSKFQDINLKTLRNFIKTQIQQHKYQYAIREYQQSLGMLHIFHDKLDEAHSLIAYCYLKTLQFKKVQNEFDFLPLQISKLNKTNILYQILKKKYKSKEQRMTTQKHYNVDLKKIPQIVTILQQLQDPFDSKHTSQSDKELSHCLLHSMKKKESNNSNSHNIISFDSSRHNNYMVNIIFAAQIEKCTHRPIMHMFDTIVCKNSSALIATWLNSPKSQKIFGHKLQIPQSEHYHKSQYPRHAAHQLIYKIMDGIQVPFNTDQSFMNQFQSLQIYNLPIDLVIVRENNKKDIKNILTSRCRSDPLLEQNINHPTLFHSLRNSVSHYGKQQLCNPLLDVYDQEYLPALSMKSQYNINILSLGSATWNTNHQNKTLENNLYIRKWNTFDRWQPVLDREKKMMDLTKLDYIDHARMFLEERWIDKTKEMRDLMDRLEDRDWKY